MGITFNPFTGTLDFTGSGGGGGGGTPGGADTDVQFNDGGSFGGDATFTFNKTTKQLFANRLSLESPDDSHALLKFLQATQGGTIVPAIYMDNDGTWHLFSSDATAELKLNPNNTWQFAGEFAQPINYSAPGNVARIAQLAGVDFIGANNDGPGTGDSSPGRFFYVSAKDATALAPVGSISLGLSGTFWNGAASVQKAIELGNVVRTTGNPELWLQQLSGGAGHPFMRAFWDQSVTGVIATHDQDTYKLALQAYDVDGAAYKTFLLLTAANTPSCTISQPSGGSLLILPPTSDPHVAGTLWNNSGLPVISAG